MSDEPEITVDYLLRNPRKFNALAAAAEQDHFARTMFGYEPPPARRRFDPRRLLARWRKPPPLPPMRGGKIVYEAEGLGIALTSAKAGEVVTIDLETPAMAAERILRDAGTS